jgi:hypothetical protein
VGRKPKPKTQPLTEEEVELIENICNKTIKVLKKRLFPKLKDEIDKDFAEYPRDDMFDEFHDYCIDGVRAMADSIIADELYTK